MIGTIKKVESVTREIKNGERKGQKFSQIILTVDVDLNVDENGNGDIRTLKATMSTEYAVKYFSYCGLKSKDLYDKKCSVVLAKRRYIGEDGSEKSYTYIKWLHMIDENGEDIYLPNEEENKLPF